MRDDNLFLDVLYLNRETKMQYLTDALLDEIYLAGEHVPSGRYREVDTKREVMLDKDGYLPASLDGRVAAYACIRTDRLSAPRKDHETRPQQNRRR